MALSDTRWRARVRKHGAIAIDSRQPDNGGGFHVLLTPASAQNLMDRLADALDQHEQQQLARQETHQ